MIDFVVTGSAVATAAGAILSAAGAAAWGLLKYSKPHAVKLYTLWNTLLADVKIIKEQWMPNGGQSAFDKIERIDQRVSFEIATRQLTERRAIYEGEVLPDGRGRTVSLSREYQRITGMTVETMDDGGWLMAVHPDHRERVKAAADEARESNTMFHAIYLARHVESHMTTWVEHVGKPLRDSRGHVFRWVGLMTIIEAPSPSNYQQAPRALSSGEYLRHE